MESLNDLLKPQPINSIPGSIGSIKDIKSSKYILDNDNHLMDDTGNYILDEEGNQIKLT
jgi:flagellar basal body rod protein FlgG